MATRRSRQYRNPPTRPVDGIVLLDKPAGISSNKALQQVRGLFAADKAGHTGSLDPLATGLLPICLGEACKVAGVLLAERKAYETLIRLGVDTDTDDAEGTVVATRPVPALDPAALDATLREFTGRIAQVPPRYSALKRDGEALYARARRGELIRIDARDVDVFAIDVLAIGTDTLRLRIECGSGTYIRSLARDIGARLGCGGHVETLRRLWVEPFRNPAMFTLEALAELAAQSRERIDATLLPIESGLAGYPRFSLDAEQAHRVRHGVRIRVDPALAPGAYAVSGPDGLVFALVEFAEDRLLRIQRLLHRG
ncbi:tRNA pseudouridine(55) synthase TruB [Chiayiivirga flava]|uniref:tRNA pseudouridine synthase B n=1 Tax=Chiayiivirga flava TaxID=659595 RepID=A0A7W8D2K0_9GAMM|nr:tRNA pseudouridine55 synthase [Chiayiivirga flava]